MAQGGNQQVDTVMKPAESKIKEINTAQCDISRLLQMAYIATKKQPEIAARIRLTAHLTRTQRVESATLIRKFEMSARHVQETLIPMVLEGVELQESSIIEGTLEEILSLAEEMKAETEKARENCLKIQTEVQDHIGKIEIKNKEIKDRIANIAIEKEKASQSAMEANAALVEQKRLLNEIQEDGKEKQQRKEALQKNYDKAADASLSFDDEKLIKAALFPTDTSPLVVVAAGAVNLLSQGLNAYRKSDTLKKAADQVKEADDKLSKNKQDERDNLKKQQDIKEKRLQQLFMFKKLCLELETTGDVSGLIEASGRLGEDDTLLSEIIQFWDTMALCITFLMQNTSASRRYIKAIEKERVQQLFLKAIEKANKGWCEFERICKWYHDVCEGDTADSNRQLYDFLSKPIENISKEEIQDQQKAIADKIEAEIKDAGLGNDEEKSIKEKLSTDDKQHRV